MVMKEEQYWYDCNWLHWRWIFNSWRRYYDYLTNKGYIKELLSDTFKSQNSGGVGVKGNVY